MARVYSVKKARKDQGNCRACGKPILRGMAYNYKEPRYGGIIKVHANCPMKHYWGSSSKMVAIWEEIDSITANTIAIEVADALHSLADTVRGVADEYQESCDNQREYFPDSEIAEENEQKATDLTDWADEIESEAGEAEDLIDGMEALLEEQRELNSKDTLSEDEQSRLDEIDGEIESVEQDILDKLNIADNCPI